MDNRRPAIRMKTCVEDSLEHFGPSRPNTILFPVTGLLAIGLELAFGTSVGVEEVLFSQAMKVRSEQSGVIGRVSQDYSSGTERNATVAMDHDAWFNSL